MKRCFKCLRDLELSEFYRHAQMADGYLGKCRDCTKKDIRLAIESRIEHYRAYDRERAKLPHRVALSKKVNTSWRRADKRRDRAHNAARRHYDAKETVCEMCGLPKKLEMHHPDYDQPLLVLFLCKPCHIQADKVRRLMEARKEKAS